MNSLSFSNETESMKKNHFIYHSIEYKNKIKSCILDLSDLENLYNTLKIKVNEAVRLELDIKNLPENSNDEIAEKIRDLGGQFLVEIWGENNIYLNSTHESIFTDKRIPKNISKISFSSRKILHVLTNILMTNYFEIVIDFKRNEILNFSKLDNSVNKNHSEYLIQGTNSTWVDGVQQAINNFLKDKETKRAWI